MSLSNESKFLKQTVIHSDVFTTCLQHALTTEKQEVMGLLIGQIDHQKCTSEIVACIIMRRVDKQADRVEISPEQLYYGAQLAEKLSTRLNMQLTVVGWYHSHPHITVWPSHVDLKTQLAYQQMDPLFVGLIFSVFTAERSSMGNLFQLICFQAYSKDSTYHRRDVELVIENKPLRKHNLESMISVPKILVQEDDESREDKDNVKDSSIEDKLATLHNDAFRTQALVQIISKVGVPLYDGLQARIDTVTAKIAELENLKKELLSITKSRLKDKM